MSADHDKQEQKGGNSSLNLQAGGDITLGISYAEVRQIAADVFNANFLELSDVAHKVARQRADELISEYLEVLQKRNPKAIESTQDPDMQYALYTSQKEYARTGDKDLASILVDILVDRASNPKRSLLQIVLNESLSVAPKLTAHQYNILSLNFRLRYTRRTNTKNLDEFGQYLKLSVLPLMEGVDKDEAFFEHLEYAGCGSFDRLQHFDVPTTLRDEHPGLFSAGAEQREVDALRETITNIDSMIFPCMNDPSKFQVNALSDDVIKDKCLRNGINDAGAKQLIDFQHSHLLDGAKVLAILVQLDPRMQSLVDIWNDSRMGSFTLTSVGKAIAHANIRRKTGENLNLNIWIK